MFRLLLRRLAIATLANGTVLDGQLNPNNRQMLLSGTAKFSDGRVFRGRFHQVHGYPLAGAQLQDDGDRYRGEYNMRWQRHGTGEAWLHDGTYYKGTFVNDELVQGIVRIPNGVSEITFNGTLHDELFVRGRLQQANYTYEGQFENNQPSGNGKLVFANGAQQEGTFYAGKLHGSNCKMRLGGGFVYVGQFFDGHIRTGVLYTPTYTYEGQFNEHGKAHGQGIQTYLITQPRLTFTGIWSHGMLVRGTCVDEYGNPVDWQDNHALQAKVLGNGDENVGHEQVAKTSYFNARIKQVERMKKQVDANYVADAEKVAKKTGVFPSKYDLGYEKSLADNNSWCEKNADVQRKSFNKVKQSAAAIHDEFEAQKKEVHSHVIGELNENMAKINFIHQKSAQQLAKQRVDEQFERFMKTFDKPVRYGTSEIQNALGNDDRLNIDSNFSWKSYLPTKE